MTCQCTLHLAIEFRQLTGKFGNSILLAESSGIPRSENCFRTEIFWPRRCVQLMHLYACRRENRESANSCVWFAETTPHCTAWYAAGHCRNLAAGSQQIGSVLTNTLCIQWCFVMVATIVIYYLNLINHKLDGSQYLTVHTSTHQKSYKTTQNNENVTRRCSSISDRPDTSSRPGLRSVACPALKFAKQRPCTKFRWTCVYLLLTGGLELPSCWHPLHNWRTDFQKKLLKTRLCRHAFIVIF